nr:copper resistance protein CopC [Halalkalicoccus sp. NIPERK01]
MSETTPENGEQVEEPPGDVILSFSGDGVQLAEVSVVGPGGEDVSGEARVDPDDSRLVSVPVEGDGEGTYVVEWEVLAADGHITAGSYFFSVGDEPLDREQVIGIYDEEEEELAPLEAGARGLVLLALVGLVGVPLTLWIAVYPLAGRFAVPVDRAERRALGLLAFAGGLLLVGVVGLGLAQSASLAPLLSVDGVGRFLGTDLGALWVVQLGLAAVALGAPLAARYRSLRRRYWLGGALVGAVGVQLTVSATSHSAGLLDGLEGVLVDFAHIAGAAFWVGGLLTLAVVVPALLNRAAAADRAAIAAETIRRFSVVALVGVTLAATTGLVLAAWHVPSAEALLSTVYGTALSAKTLLVLLALGLGGFVRFVLLRRLRGASDASAFTRGVRIEAGVLVAVVLLSAVITSVPTAAVAGGGPGETSVDGGDVSLSVLPAEEGNGVVLVDEGEPVVIETAFDDEAEDVSLLMYNSQEDVTLTTELEATEEGPYATVQTLPAPGSWEVRVSALVGGTYTAEWFELFSVPDHPGHDHDHTAPVDESFVTWLRLGALCVGVLGTTAVAVETVLFDRRAR